MSGSVYSRYGHPNASVLAQKIDALEQVEGGIMTGSGMAAVTAALLVNDLPRFGIMARLVDPDRREYFYHTTRLSPPC